METKHTPGPWKLIEQGDANMYGMVTAGNRWIISFQQNGELMSETQLANAKLMAAAPELLNVCVEISRIKDLILPPDPVSGVSEQYHDEYKAICNVIRMAEQAVEKATE